MCEIARDNGHQAAFDADNRSFPLMVEISGGGPVRVSSHMLTRIGLDFLSPGWIVRSALERSSTADSEEL